MIPPSPGSNWRCSCGNGTCTPTGNYLLIESLRTYHSFYGESLRAECPTGSKQQFTLAEVADERARRLTRLFLPGEEGQRPCHGTETRYARDPHFRDLVLFYEYFHGDPCRGCGAPHQTGWTALVASLLQQQQGRGQRTE